MIVDQVNLSSARHFPCDRFTDGLLAVLHDKCLNRQPVLRRFLQHAHVADTDQTHSHAEALFLVDDQEPKAVKLYILRQKPVRPDDNVAHALLQIPNCLGLLRL